MALDGEDMALPVGYELATVPVPDAWTGHAVDALPPEQLQGLVVLMAIRPGGRATDIVAATSDLVLEADWRVVVLGKKGAIRRLREDAEAAEQ
jgi:Trk K+ transport system NAD-binding subunit